MLDFLADHLVLRVGLQCLQALGCLGTGSLMPLELVDLLPCLFSEMGVDGFGVVVAEDQCNQPDCVVGLDIAKLLSGVVVLDWVVSTIVVSCRLCEAPAHARLTTVAPMLWLPVVGGCPETCRLVQVYGGGFGLLLVVFSVAGVW